MDINNLILDLKSIVENETYEDMKQALLDLINELEEIFKKKCRYLYGDWCHHPDLEFQEQCNFYVNQKECPAFKEKM